MMTTPPDLVEHMSATSSGPSDEGISAYISSMIRNVVDELVNESQSKAEVCKEGTPCNNRKTDGSKATEIVDNSPKSNLVSSPSPNNIAVYSESPTKGKKRPRFLLTISTNEEGNKNNHHPQRATDVDSDSNECDRPLNNSLLKHPDEFSDTSSEFQSFNESCGFELGVSDSEVYCEVNEQPLHLCHEMRDLLLRQSPDLRPNDASENIIEYPVEEFSYEDLLEENRRLRNEIVTIRETYKQEIDNAYTEIMILNSNRARDAHNAYEAGFEFASSAKDSDLKKNIVKQMTVINELANEIHELQNILKRQESEAHEVNERLLRECIEAKEIISKLLNDRYETENGYRLPAATHMFFRAFHTNSKALASCVEMQSIINEQRLVMITQHQQIHNLLLMKSGHECVPSNNRETGDSAFLAGEISNDTAVNLRQNTQILHRRYDSEHQTDPQMLIVTKFELGTDLAFENDAKA